MNPLLKELTVNFLIFTAYVKSYLTKLFMKTRPDVMSQQAKFLGHRMLRQSCHRWRQRTFYDILKSHLMGNGLLFSQINYMESQAPWHRPPILDKKGASPVSQPFKGIALPLGNMDEVKALKETVTPS